MKKIIIILIIIFCNTQLHAQEVNLPQYVNHLADNPFLISPAYAGIGTGLQIRLNGISQWVGVENSPDTQSLTVESRLTDRLGGGVTLFNDKNGDTAQKGAKLSLASHLTLSDFNNSFLSLGLTYSFVQFSQDTSNSNVFDPSAPIFDPTAPSRNINNSNFDVSILYRFDRFAISANVFNLLDKNVENFTAEEPKILRQYSVFTSYTFARMRNRVEIEPSILVKHFEADKRSETDLNVKVRKGVYDGYVWAGLSYTFLNENFFKPNTVSPLFGIKKNNLFLSYGFSITLNRIQDFNYGTHMVTLGFDYERRPSLARCTQKMIIF